jgi:hypothetical protein
MNKKFRNTLNQVVSILGSGETSNTQLDKVCYKLFGNQFAGTFSSDKIPKMNKKSNMCVLNLDDSSQQGSHWVSIIFDNNTVYVYDSFDRNAKNILPSIFNKYKVVRNTDRTSVSKAIRQKDYEEDCGQRCVASLIIYKVDGLESFKLL